MSIDGTNPDNFTGRVLDEKQTRANILNWAKVMGDNYLYKDIVLLFEKYDKLIRLCKNDKEVKDMREMGVLELYRLMSSRTSLYNARSGKLIAND